MPDKISFSAQKRTLMGKKTNQLRTQGLIPANVMGNGVESTAVSIVFGDFNKLYSKVGDTGLVYLNLEGESKPRPVLISEVHPEPRSGKPLHVVFKQVNLKEKISAEIPVEVVGEFGVADAVLITVHPTIEVEALPTDFPENFTIDASQFTEIGQGVNFSQLDFDRTKVTLMISEEELETPVVSVQPLAAEVVEEEVAPAEEGAPAEGGEATPAAEAPAEPAAE